MYQVDKYVYGKAAMSSEPKILNSPWPHVNIPLVSLHKFLLQRLETFSDQSMIECETNRFFTFQQFAHDSRLMANAWKSLGLIEGNVFGVVGENCYEYLTLYLGGIMVGGIASGIRLSDTYREVTDKLIQRNIKYLAISNKNFDIAKKISEGIPVTQKIILFNGGKKINEKFELYSELINSHEPIGDDMISIPNDVKKDICMITGTSGATNYPKPVVFSHYSIVAAVSITSLPVIFGYTTFDVVSAHSQFAHQSAIFQVFSSIATGSRIAIMPQFDYENFIKCTQRYKISAAMLSKSTIICLLKDPKIREEICSLTKIICFGSVLPKNIGHQFVQRYSHVKDFRQAFLQTESMGPISIMIKGSNEYDCLGVPIPNTRVKIVDPDTGEHLGPNQHGEICVFKDDGLSKGYFRNEEANCKLIDVDGWLHTGDIGYYDDDGVLYIVERIEQIIKTAGILIYPVELEEQLLMHDAVWEAAVTSIPDDDAGQVPIAFVILKPNYCGKISGYDIEQFVNDQLPKRRRLRSVQIVESFPKTSLGKVIKRQLRDDFLFNLNKRKF